MGQRPGKAQEQHRAKPRARQGRRAQRSPAGRRHTAQGKGGIAPRRPAGCQGRRQEKADAHGQQPSPLLLSQYDLTVPHSLSLPKF